MKLISFVLTLIISFQLSAQQAGKVGEKIPNEINASSSVQKKKQDYNKRNNDKGNPKGGYSQGNQSGYNWNQTYTKGYAEVFIRIPENGLFSISLDDQELTTPIGIFRFFDVIPGQNLMKIYQNGRIIYQTKLRVDNNERMIFDFFTYEGLYLLDSISLHPRYNQENYYDVWNQTWNDMYNGNSQQNDHQWNPNYGQNDNPLHGNHQQGNHGYNQNQGNQPNYDPNHGNYAPKPMLPQDFEQFKNTVKQQSFEDTKLQMIKTNPKNIWFTANQIKELMQLFSFDDNRLEVGKYCYDICVDKQNYYTTYNALTYDNSKNELMEYISNRK